MADYDHYVHLKPPGRRVGGTKRYTAAEVFARKVAISRRVLEASLAGEPLYQKADLWSLPECSSMRTDRGIGDFIGKSASGLDLDLQRVADPDRDWLIPPSPWQALRAWDWLKRYCPDRAESIAAENGFQTAADLDADIARRLDAATTAEDDPADVFEEGPVDDVPDWHNDDVIDAGD